MPMSTTSTINALMRGLRLGRLNQIDLRGGVRNFLGLNYADDLVGDERFSKEQTAGTHGLYWNGVIGMFSESATANYTNLYLLSLNATNPQIGLLNTLTQVATAITPLPGATLAERTGWYRGIILWPNVLARIGLLLLAALPLLFGNVHGAAIVTVAMTIFIVRAILSQFTTAAWTAFVGRLVPAKLRVRYFSARTFAMSVTSMLGTLLAGQLIAALGSPIGYQVVFVVAGVVGLIASYISARIPASQYPERAMSAPTVSAPTIRPVGQTKTQSPLGNVRAEFAANPAFLRYTIAGGALALAVGIGGPFIQVYQARALGFDAGQIGLIVTAELLSNLVCGRVYGSLIFLRYGDYRVMRVLRLLTGVVPFGWVFIRDPILGALNQALAGAIWSGHELAAFNGLLSVTPEAGRARYIALNTFVISICAAIGPALGGVLSEVIGYQPLFVLSAVLRVAAGVVFILLVKDWNS